MAFSFGAAPTPAPAFGTQSAGQPSTGTPAFGSTPAPAFGSSTPAPSAFGTTPAPAPSTTGGLFGSVPAPAFGSTTTQAPAPSTGFSFASTGTTPAPAPTGGLFGSSTPAPSTGLFGSTPAPSTGLFGSTPAPSTGLFGSTTSQPTQPTAPPMMMITSSTPYSSLPPEAKRAIDTIHQEIMRHKKTMANVETMAPALLREPVKAADAAAGGDGSNLHKQLQELQHNLEGLQVNIHKCRERAVALKGQMEVSTTQSIMYGMWPVEAVAVRRGVKLSSNEKSTSPAVRAQLQTLLDQQVAHVDRVERIPSPYMWQTLEDLERRVGSLMQQLSTLNRELDANASDEVMDVASIVHSQTEAIARVAYDVMRVHEHMEQLRTKYRQTERGENILDKADVEEFERQRRLEQQSKQQYMKAAGSAAQQAPATSTTAPAPGGLFSSAPAPGGLFSSTPAPASGGGLFGGSTSTSTPAPAATTTAPAPSGGLFGSTPAPSTGTTPAPATTAPAAPPQAPLFGSSTPAPGTAAPAAPPQAPLFSSSTPAPGTAAPAAPPQAPLFGSSTPAPATTAPAPSTGFSFTGATASAPSAPTATATTPRSKGGSRSRNRSGRR